MCLECEEGSWLLRGHSKRRAPHHWAGVKFEGHKPRARRAGPQRHRGGKVFLLELKKQQWGYLEAATVFLL